MDRRLRLIPILFIAFVVLFKYWNAEKVVNPETGKKSRVALSSKEESLLGLQSYQEVLSQSQVLRTGPEVDQVTRVARRLAAATGEAGQSFEWQVSVVQSPQVNAFCLPGGKIVVYTGILPVTQTDSALAAVMGHEMAHATSRHGSQRLFQSSLAQTVMQGVSLSLLDMDPRQRQAVMGALGAGAQFGVILPFSRGHETEADEIGILYMARAGYDPHEAIQFWQRMSATGGQQPPQYMSTHPAHETRIRQLQEFMPRAMAEYNKAQRAPQP